VITTATARILVPGRPGSGKSTAARKIAQLLHEAGVTVTGFVTEERRRGRQRVGFTVASFQGEEAVLAGVDLPGPPRVGKYGVDLGAFETVALASLRELPRDGVVVIDELGKMELASAAFRDAVEEVFAATIPVVATVHVYGHPFTDRLKRRRDVEIVTLSPSNRDRLPFEVVARLVSGRD
jgi:nucleoside-triphosphatase